MVRGPSHSLRAQNMTIDTKTGDLVVGIERLGPDLAESEFLNSASGKSAAKVRQTSATNWYETWFGNVPGIDVGVVLGFPPEGRLQRIRLKLVKPELRGPGSPGWSKEVEDEMKAFHDNWLRNQIGEQPYNFQWGCIKSTIDQHGYSAVVVFVYGPKT